MDKKYWILGGAILGLIIVGTLYFLTRPKTPQNTELNFVTESEDEKNLADYIAAFETQNNTKINFIKLDPQNYELESLNLLSTGKVDIWGIPNNWLPKQHDKLAPFSGKFTATATDNIAYYQNLYPKIVVTENIINDKIYGLPLSLDTLVLFINNDVKSKEQDLTNEEEEVLSAELKNWDDLAAKSRLLTQKSGNNILLSGAALGTDDLPAAPDILTALMLQGGAQMTDENKTKATFHTAINQFGGASFPAAAALDFYASFGQTNNQNYSFSKALGDPLKAFTSSKAAFYIDYSAKEQDLIRLNPNLNYQVKALPQVKATKNPVNFASYETLTVPNTSKNQTLAWQFLTGLVQPDNLKEYFEQSKKHPALTELADAGSIIEQSLQTAESWYNPEPTAVAKIFREAISQTLTGQQAQTALDGAAVQITALLEKIKQ